MPRRLRIVIDARVLSGESGGIEGVVIGLARGLSGLADGREEYLFVTWRGLDAWLADHVSGPARILPQPPSPARRLRARFPDLVRIWRGRPSILRRGEPAARDAFIEALDPDVVHVPFQRGFLTQRITIFHPHDLQHVHLPAFFSPAEIRAREVGYGILCRQAAMVAVASEWTRRDVEGHYDLPPGRVRVVPLAPPTEAYPEADPANVAEVRRRLRLPEGFVLYPAQTWPHKNHLGLLEALAELRDTAGLIVPLVAPGKRTGFARRLERRAADLGLAGHVSWPGFVNPADLQALYAAARAVAVPSRFEAASAPMWEAFRAGVPVASSNVTSLPEQAGDAALLFDPDDRGQMVEALRRIWTDEALRRRLIEAGRRRVAHFTWDRTARTFRAHYRRLTGSPLDDEDRALLEAPAGL